jgi:hypothetical protein
VPVPTAKREYARKLINPYNLVSRGERNVPGRNSEAIPILYAFRHVFIALINIQSMSKKIAIDVIHIFAIHSLSS